MLFLNDTLLSFTSRPDSQSQTLSLSNTHHGEIRTGMCLPPLGLLPLVFFARCSKAFRHTLSEIHSLRFLQDVYIANRTVDNAHHLSHIRYLWIAKIIRNPMTRGYSYCFILLKPKDSSEYENIKYSPIRMNIYLVLYCFVLLGPKNLSDISENR